MRQRKSGGGGAAKNRGAGIRAETAKQWMDTVSVRKGMQIFGKEHKWMS
ncbi:MULTISPECIES: hypothetical protein [Brenneria]|nr:MULTISPECIES: hypothetical protein [Brenneria]